MKRRTRNARNDRSRNVWLTFERAEPRQMLHGNLEAFLQNDRLFVVADDTSNQIVITGNLQGGITVQGLDSTTVNGGSSPFVTGQVRGLIVRLNGGDDELDITGVVTGPEIRIEGGSGDDRVMVAHSHTAYFSFDGGFGNDLLSLDHVYASIFSQLQFGDGHDNLAVIAHSIGAHLVVEAGAGDDLLVFNHLGMRRQLHVDTGSGGDHVLFAGRTWLGSSSSIRSADGNDFIGMLGDRLDSFVRFGKNMRLDTGAGDDQVILDEQTVASRGVFSGGPGNDRLERSSVLAALFRTESWEHSSINNLQGTLNSIHERLVDLDIDPVNFGGPAIPTQLRLVAQSSTGQFTEGGSDLVVDDSLVLTGPPDEVITSATVSIDGFRPGLDLLLFTNAATISGDFNATTGVLTLTGTGTLAQWQGALRSVRFRNTEDNPPTAARRFTFEVESADDMAAASRQVAIVEVPDSPSLSVTDDEQTVDIDGTADPFPLAIAPDMALTDPDTSEFDLARVNVVIAGGGRNGDVLALSQTPQGVTANYNAATRTLTFTGSLTTSALQGLLRNVTFNNTNDRAPVGNRRISFTVSDGDLTVNEEVVVQVQASEAATISTSETVQSFTETDDPVQVDAAVTINPATNASASDTITSAKVSFTSGYSAAQDRLEFDAQTGITGSFDTATGILAFTGDGTIQAYQQLLRSVRYRNDATGSSLVTGNRVIEFQIVNNATEASSSRPLLVSRASDERLIQNYLEDNDLTSQAQRTDSGLYYIVEQTGNGQFPNANSTVTVNYDGFLLNGSQFDGNDGVDFNLQDVIEGWTEGIPKFSKGGSGQLLIPSALAYGSQARPGIPPNSVLRFEIDLLDFV